jgi:tetratricopeptide (TPR) repeat protein
LRQLKEAEGLAEGLLARYPGNWEVLSEAADIYFAQGDYARAAQMAQKATAQMSEPQRRPGFLGEQIRRNVCDGPPAWNDPMHSEETPDILDALIAAGVKARIENLVRAARRQAILSRVAFGGAVLVVLGVPAALLAGDRLAAGIIAILACITLSFTYFAGKAGRKKALESLRQMGQSPE